MHDTIISRNNVKIFGQGDTTLMFAHGFGCDQTMWRYITPAFVPNHKIVLFDYVGSGESDLSFYDFERYGSLSGYAQDIVDICDALSLNDVILVGHSVSCMIGVLASIKKPHAFKSLILIAPSVRYINDLPSGYYGGFEKEDIDGIFDVMESNYAGWANFLAPVIMKNPERPELAAELEESFCTNDPEINKRFARVTFLSDSRNDVLKITHPTLVMQCSEDIIAPETAGLYIYENVTGSNYIKMQAIGHCPHMSHPKETIKYIDNYITALHH